MFFDCVKNHDGQRKIRKPKRNDPYPNSKWLRNTATNLRQIGGGDFANDRIIPDCVRAVEKGDTIIVRNPNSIHYQHVLEPLKIYLVFDNKGIL